MGVDGGSTSPGANIGQFNCDGTANQRWFMNIVGGTPASPVELINGTPTSGRCVGVDRASTANGAQLKQFPRDGSRNQRRRLINRS